MTQETKSKLTVNARLLDIVELIAGHVAPVSPADVSLLLDIPKPTVHRLLQYLQTAGYVRVDERGNWVPASRLSRLARHVLFSDRQHLERLAILQALTTETGETSGISIPQGLEMIYFERVQSNWPLQIHLPTGTSVPLWCTASGKLYLSSLPKPKRQRILNALTLSPYSKNTILDKEVLEKDILDAHKHHFSVDNEEFVDGMVACSVPITDRDGHLLACLFIHAPTVRKSLTELLTYLPAMQKTATELAGLVDQ